MQKAWSPSDATLEFFVYKMEQPLSIGTVFSGIGAIEQAIKRLAIPHVIKFACDNGERIVDIDYKKEYNHILSLNNALEKKLYVDSLYRDLTRKINFVQQSYLANYSIENNLFFQDIKLFDGKDFENKIDLFVGGSPCQSFSIAGSRGGFEDTRGTLFYEFVRLVKEIKPKVFLYENVYGVLNHDKGRTWETMKNVFSDLGYYFQWKILDARNFGIPQGRRRLFVVGFFEPIFNSNFSFPESIPLHFTMQDFLEENLAIGGLQNVNGELKIVSEQKGNPDDRYYLSEKLLKYCLSPGTKNFMHYDAKIDLPIARALVKNMGNSYRASVNNYVTTNGRVRALTMREVHRLMGFPDSYKIVVSKAQAYKQAGNSIVVDVLMHIMKQILKTKVFDGKDL